MKECLECTVDNLKEELENEKKLRDRIIWSNNELEKTIQELEEEIISVNSSETSINEWKVRLEAQLSQNQQLEERKRRLEMELAQSKRQIIGPVNMNIDSLTETELIRYVKLLERNKTNLQSKLRDYEWQLDKEGKDYHRLSEIRSMYQAELRHYTRILERLRNKKFHIDVNYTKPLKWRSLKKNQRIIDPKKGPVRKTVGVTNLPKIKLKKSGKQIKHEEDDDDDEADVEDDEQNVTNTDDSGITDGEINNHKSNNSDDVSENNK